MRWTPRNALAPLVPLLFLGACIGTVAGCGGNDSVVFVTVTGRPMVADVAVLLVDIQHGDDVISADLGIPAGATLPQTFTITPNSRKGMIEVRIAALDAGSVETGRGATTVTIPTGGQATIEVMLEPTDRVLNQMIVSAQTLTVTATHTGRQLARSADGNAIALWENFCPASRCDILARRFDTSLRPLQNATSLTDGDFLVNQLPEFTTTPAITAGPGGYLAAWRTTDDVKVAPLGPDGAQLGADVAVTNGTTFEGIPFVIARPTGFWTAWEQGRADGTREIRARRVTSAGAVDGASVIVSPAAGTNGAVSGASLTGGQTVFVWTRSEASDHAIVGRVYGDDGSPTTGELDLVPPVAGLTPGGPVAIPVGNGFALIYRQGTELVARQFGPDGLARGDATTLSETPVATNAVPAVALRDDTTVGVAWHACDDTQGNQACDIRVRTFAGATLAPTGPERIVNTTRAGDQTGPSIAPGDGGFIVVWTDASARAPDTDDDAIRGIVVYDQ